MTITKIKRVLDAQPDLEIAILVGSQSEGNARAESDWDVAIQWDREITALASLANTETLRHNLAVELEVTEDRIDLIDLPRAGLAMRAIVAEAGVPLLGEDSLAWNHFLGRTWRELEQYEKEKQSAA